MIAHVSGVDPVSLCAFNVWSNSILFFRFLSTRLHVDEPKDGLRSFGGHWRWLFFSVAKAIKLSIHIYYCKISYMINAVGNASQLSTLFAIPNQTNLSTLSRNAQFNGNLPVQCFRWTEWSVQWDLQDWGHTAGEGESCQANCPPGPWGLPCVASLQLSRSLSLITLGPSWNPSYHIILFDNQFSLVSWLPRPRSPEFCTKMSTKERFLCQGEREDPIRAPYSCSINVIS